MPGPYTSPKQDIAACGSSFVVLDANCDDAVRVVWVSKYHEVPGGFLGFKLCQSCSYRIVMFAWRMFQFECLAHLNPLRSLSAPA